MGAEVQARPAERDGVTGVWRGRCSHHYRQGNRDKRQPRHTGGKRIQRSREEENRGGNPAPGPDRRRGWARRAEAGGRAARDRSRRPPPFPRARAHGQGTCHLPGARHGPASPEARPLQTSPASQLCGEASRVGPGLVDSTSCPCAQGPVLPTAAARVPGLLGLTVRECLLPLSEPRV